MKCLWPIILINDINHNQIIYGAVVQLDCESRGSTVSRVSGAQMLKQVGIRKQEVRTGTGEEVGDSVVISEISP